MQYNNLQDLIRSSSSSRKYFLSLPVNIQIELHKQNQYIHSAAQLHRRAEEVQSYLRQVQLSEYYSF